ncbi:NAD kinase [Solimicrobium silvestre]|uniref:NAD kinase n=1 Tax=Solimicrobium silvestre TaxID=2099400 RepID=A0A2S9GTP1_9BURK|nr:NAD kinase [Solimicrobium silvestre]PRC91092.1 putative sugar kinase [Solimicrobium silvestre]
MTTSPAVAKTIALVGKYSAAGIAKDLLSLAHFLVEAGHTVVLEQETATNLSLTEFTIMPPAQIGQHADVAIVLGGDGTMLGIARQLAPYQIPLIGINQGRLGFMTDIPIEQMYTALSEILAGNHQLEQRSLLEGVVIRDGQEITSGLAFNDIVVARGAGSGMVELKVTVDNHFMYNQRSDGLIISTPTGSTAYALSAGGPLMHPNLAGIVFVPIAPHALSNRPIVVSDSSKIIIEISAVREASVNFDMQSFAHLMVGDQIHIQRSKHVICFLHPKEWNYYHTLRDKMHWNEYPTVNGNLN